MPKAVYGYWMSNGLIELYSPSKAIDKDVAEIKQGTSPVPDVRFLRLAWEVSPSQFGLGKKWPPFAKGGQYSPFFDDIHLLLKWERGGRELMASSKDRPFAMHNTSGKAELLGLDAPLAHLGHEFFRTDVPSATKDQLLFQKTVFRL